MVLVLCNTGASYTYSKEMLRFEVTIIISNIEPQQTAHGRHPRSKILGHMVHNSNLTLLSTCIFELRDSFHYNPESEKTKGLFYGQQDTVLAH